MKLIDINADLGESFGPWKMGEDAQILDIVSSANIACGGHAGDPTVMYETIKIASDKGVTIGAHPGFVDKQGFGRRKIPLEILEIEQLIASQVGALVGMARLAKARVDYIKPHGALNNWATENTHVSEAIARSIKLSFPELSLLAVSGTKLEAAGLKFGLKTFSEIFADRGYNKNGTLVARGEKGALITDTKYAIKRLLHFLDTGEMPTVCGSFIKMNAHSICIHGDNPHAIEMSGNIRRILQENNFKINSFL